MYMLLQWEGNKNHQQQYICEESLWFFSRSINVLFNILMIIYPQYDRTLKNT